MGGRPSTVMWYLGSLSLKLTDSPLLAQWSKILYYRNILL